MPKLGFELKPSASRTGTVFMKRICGWDTDQRVRLTDLLIQPILQMAEGPERSEGS